MAFECNEPGCAYHASSRAALAQHKRTRHPGAKASAGKMRYTLQKAKNRFTSGRSFARSLTAPSGLWRLPKNALAEIGRSLTGKKGTLQQQIRAAGNNVRNLTRNLGGRGGARKTRRGNRK
jgi:hypothetical protein